MAQRTPKHEPWQAIAAVAGVIVALTAVIATIYVVNDHRDEDPPSTTTFPTTTTLEPRIKITDPPPAAIVDRCINVRITADRPIPKGRSLWVVVATSNPLTQHSEQTLWLQRRPIRVMGDELAWTALTYIGGKGRADWGKTSTIMAVITTGDATERFDFIADSSFGSDRDPIIADRLPKGAVVLHSVTVSRKFSDSCPLKS